MNDLQKCAICGMETRHLANIKGYAHFKCTHCGHLPIYTGHAQTELDDLYQKGANPEPAELQRDRFP